MSPPHMTIPDELFRTSSGLIIPKEFDDPTREKFRVTGDWEFKLFDKDGKLIDKREKRNLIVDVGFQLISDCLFAQTSRPTVAQYTAVGTGSTAAAAGQTALVAESARVSGTYSYAAKVATLATTFNAGVATAALQEAGVFNASSTGIMLNRVVFSVINKGSLDVLTTTFTFTLS